MARLVKQVICPFCHRRQAPKKGEEIPFLWFEGEPRDILIQYTRAYGGQGRGIKGPNVKPGVVGFQLDHTQTIPEAYLTPENRDIVRKLYRQAKALVAYMESEGIHG